MASGSGLTWATLASEHMQNAFHSTMSNLFTQMWDYEEAFHVMAPWHAFLPSIPLF